MIRLIPSVTALLASAALIVAIPFRPAEPERAAEPSQIRASVGVGRNSTLPEPETVTEPPEAETTMEPVIVEEPTSLGTFKLTAYCPCPKCCGQWADGITYTGTEATAGRTIAVDPNVIPLGSTVHINGQAYTAEDIGGAIKGNRIDVYFPTHTEALQFGVQYAEVAID